MRDLDSGIVYVNAPTIGAETHLPFGGTKQTGNGHLESAVTALDFYSEWKSVYVDYSDRLQRAQIDTLVVRRPLRGKPGWGDKNWDLRTESIPPATELRTPHPARCRKGSAFSDKRVGPDFSPRSIAWSLATPRPLCGAVQRPERR